MSQTLSNKAHMEQQQKVLASQVGHVNTLDEVRYVAGVDVAYNEEANQVVGAVVVLDANTLKVVESQVSVEPIACEYIPGLFSFREVPPLLSAYEKLTIKPQLIVCDGHGTAHPRRFGLACHLGVTLNVATIGCAKTKLLGEYAPLESVRASSSDLYDNVDVIGQVLRTQTDTKPVFVSIGHQVDLPTAIDWVLKLTPKYRLPETTRHADQLVNKTLKALR